MNYLKRAPFLWIIRNKAKIFSLAMKEFFFIKFYFSFFHSHLYDSVMLNQVKWKDIHRREERENIKVCIKKVPQKRNQLSWKRGEKSENDSDGIEYKFAFNF